MTEATEVVTVTEFLLARIDEDEKTARMVLGDYAQHAPRWSSPSSGVVEIGDPGLEGLVPLGDGPLAHHIARHDPARVLAECEAKRRQIEHLIDFMEGDYAPWNEDQLKMMATVYADHPDYRDEWRV